MRFKRSFPLVCIVVFLFPATVRVWAAGTRLQDAEDAYGEGRYTDAAEGFEQAYHRNGNLHAAFGAASAYFLQGKYDKAASLFESAAVAERDPRKTAQMLYNLGNAYAERGRPGAAGSVPADSAGASEQIEWLRKAARSYERAFALDQTLSAAAYNAEIVKRWLAESAQQEQQGQQEQQNQQGQQDKQTGESEEQASQPSDDSGDGQAEQAPGEDSAGKTAEAQDETTRPAESGEEAAENELVESILNQEDENRELRATYRIRGGISEVERDW